MTINQIECFVEAAKTGSFSKAGERLFLSQQNVSRYIKTLENELGFPVFERHNLGVRLTESGKKMYEVWSAFITQHRNALDKAKDIYFGEQKKIRIAMPDMGSFLDWISEGIVSYNEQYPDLNIEYEILPMYLIMEQLNQGKTNMVFMFESELEEQTDMKSIRISSKPMQVGIFLSKAHPLAAKQIVTVEDLKGENLGVLAKEASLDYQSNVRSFLRKKNVCHEVEIQQFDSRRNLELALVSKKCVTISYESMFCSDSDKLKFYPVDPLIATPGIVIGWKDDKYCLKARNIAEFLKK